MNPSWSNYGVGRLSRHPGLWDGCLLSYAPLLGLNGLKAFDLSPIRAWGTLTGITPESQFVLDDGMYCLDMPGTTKYITFPTIAAYTPTSISISVWIKPNATGQTGKWAVGKWASSGNQRAYGVWYDLDKFKFTVSDSGTFDANETAISTITPVANTWYHVCGVYGVGTAPKIYINGALDGTAASAPTTIFTSTANLEIGSIAGGSSNINAKLDAVHIVDRPLDDAEVLLLSTSRSVAYLPRERVKSYGEVLVAAGGGGGGAGGSVGLAQPLSFKLSEPLSVRL